ncbi:serine hydrolase domain-containing protein [Isoptericola cucumis]|uniref:Serine hydrolase n=1 Tax=Isoptericola cucumis TaxID=1776856 RepID=A0ABQ2B7N1_9MICO|nr:serine hydrolase domain-containing protein [Isoptericola cucumis]GGI07144.1 serine hydrolase [Isoptericola cucumis]
MTARAAGVLQALLDRHVLAGAAPGAVASLLAVPDGAEPEAVASGAMSVGGPPMPPDALVRVMSMTKAVTAVTALRLVEAGRLGLDAPVDRWLPELADRRVLTSPTAPLTDTAPAVRPITLRHLLTCTSGYGLVMTDSPLRRAMAAAGLDVAPDRPVTVGADEWLTRLAALPLAFQPGDGWRYHHSFGVLGVLVSRVAGRPLQDHLADDLLGPLGMRDTRLWVPDDDLARLPAAYRHTGSGPVELEPAAGGTYAGRPPFDVSHRELVSTVRDYTRFARMLAAGGRSDGRQVVSPEHLRLMTSDQVPAAAKAPDSFFPGFWDGTGWGFGVGVDVEGPRAGRFGWSGGLGTTFFVDPGGAAGVLATQVEVGARLQPLFDDFQALAERA